MNVSEKLYWAAIVILSLAALAITALTTAKAQAATVVVNADGYEVEGDFYWKTISGERVPHTRTWTNGYYYYSGCCRYYKDGYYTYHRAAVVNKKVDPEDPKALLIIAEAIKRRTETDGRIKERAAAYDKFTALIKAAGLEGEFRYDAYPFAPPYVPASTYQLSAAGVNGATVYGYSLKTNAVDLYGNPSEYALLSSRLAEQANKNGAAATERFMDLAQLDAQSRERFAELLAQGKKDEALLLGIAAALKASQESKVSIRTTERKAEPMPVPVPEPARKLSAGAILDAKCSACHAGGKAAAGLVLTSKVWAELAPATRGKVLARVTSSDPTLRMPLAPDGGPGTPLTAEEMEALK